MNAIRPGCVCLGVNANFFHRPALRIAAPVLAAGLLAAACSSGGGGTKSSPPSTPPTSVPSAAAVQLAVTGGHLSVGGRTVYLWMADAGGKSSCEASCASAWPPVTGHVTAGSGVSAGQLSTFTRPDGTTQVVYAGHPLYYFVQDQAAGVAYGQGSDAFGARWWEVGATGAAITTAASNSGSSSSSSGGGGGYGY